MAKDFLQLARDLEQTANEFKRVGDRLTMQTARETRDYARRLSSGPFKTAQLRKAGHPYSRWHGAPLLDPSVINKQTGLFWQSWRIERLLLADGHIVSVVRNMAPYARYLEGGTSTAFERPMVPRLEFFAERTWDRLAPVAFAPLLTRLTAA